jgi:hypothetical protein
VKNENKPETAEKEKTMKLEEIKNKTNEAVSFESGQREHIRRAQHRRAETYFQRKFKAAS